MNKLEALENIKKLWNDDQISLGEKIIDISSDYYGVGLDLETTAAFIKATPAELDALLSLGELTDESIKLISALDPPKTTWALLASAGEEELQQALEALSNNRVKGVDKRDCALSEYIYRQMLVVAEPTSEQKIAELSGDEIYRLRKKAIDFNILPKKSTDFLASISAQKKRGKTLSDKQLSWLKSILENMIKNGAIKRESIDGDQELCDKVLDALE